MPKYPTKIYFFSNVNGEPNTTHMCLASPKISNSRMQWMCIFHIGETHIFGNIRLFFMYHQKQATKIESLRQKQQPKPSLTTQPCT